MRYSVRAEQVEARSPLVQEEQGTLGLILGGCRDTTYDRQMSQERLNLRSAKISGVPQSMETYKPKNGD